MKIIFGYQDTKTNGEDFALTPYLAGIKSLRLLGVGLVWGWWSIAVIVGYNRPDIKNFITFKTFNR